MTPAEEFAKLNEVHWHQGNMYLNRRFGCSECGSNEPNPTYSDAKSILEVCMKWKDYKKFIKKVGGSGMWSWVRTEYILNPDKLLAEAITFRKENKP